MRDDDEDDEQEPPRQGPPGRAALLREMHERRQREKRAGKLPAGVRLPPRKPGAPPPEPSIIRQKHMTSGKAPVSAPAAIVKPTLEPRAMPEISTHIKRMIDKQESDDLTNQALADILHVSGQTVQNLRVGRNQPSAALAERINLWLTGQPIPPPAMAPREARTEHAPTDEPAEAAPALARIQPQPPMPEREPQTVVMGSASGGPAPSFQTGSPQTATFMDPKINRAPLPDIDAHGIVKALHDIGADIAAKLILDQQDALQALRGVAGLEDQERAELGALRIEVAELRKLAAV